jgi:hypothetical protein
MRVNSLLECLLEIIKIRINSKYLDLTNKKNLELKCLKTSNTFTRFDVIKFLVLIVETVIFYNFICPENFVGFVE